MANITLIGRSKGYAVERLREEAAAKNCAFTCVSIHDVILGVTNNTFSLTTLDGSDISTSDCYLFRGIGDAGQEMMVVAKYLLEHGAVVIEEKTADGALLMDKLSLRLTDEHIPTPDYHLIQSEHALTELAKTCSYPAVIKATVGSMGRKVALAQNEEELLTHYHELGPRVIVQRYLAVDADVRAIVVGGKYLGAYERSRDDGEFRMNRPKSDKEIVELPADVVDLCIRAAAAEHIEIAGLDLIEHEGKWHVLEINTSPQFKQFEEVTGANVAGAIIDYALEKVAQNRT